MKRIALFALFILMFNDLSAQVNKLPDPSPSFSAIIVSNIDSSITWYREKLGFSISNRVDMEDRGFRMANLKRGNALIELIESKTAIHPKEILEGKPKRTLIAGFFKFGFMVKKFDKWVVYLKASGVDLHGDVVRDKATGKQMLIIKDPDGNRIQLFER